MLIFLLYLSRGWKMTYVFWVYNGCSVSKIQCCTSHGGGKRCSEPACQKWVVSTQGLCRDHRGGENAIIKAVVHEQEMKEVVNVTTEGAFVRCKIGTASNVVFVIRGYCPCNVHGCIHKRYSIESKCPEHRNISYHISNRCN